MISNLNANKNFVDIFGFVSKSTVAGVKVETAIVDHKLRELAARHQRVVKNIADIVGKYEGDKTPPSMEDALKDHAAVVEFEKARNVAYQEWAEAVDMAKNSSFATGGIDSYYTL